jgi:hypothetical protein
MRRSKSQVHGASMYLRLSASSATKEEVKCSEAERRAGPRHCSACDFRVLWCLRGPKARAAWAAGCREVSKCKRRGGEGGQQFQELFP